MNEKTIRRLIKLVEESDIESLEVRRFFRTIRITKTGATNNHRPTAVDPSALQVNLPTAGHSALPGVASPAAAGSPPAGESRFIEIKSPMVGTLYHAPAPNAPPFVNVDQVIKPGDVLCIIEAMKLMNEIEAEQGGRIVRILVDNAQPVEFGQPLFLLDPAVV